MSLTTLVNPPVKWRYWLVYYRDPGSDPRIKFFRGTMRNNLFIQSENCGKGGDWVWEPERARLFQFEPIIAPATISKRFGDERRQHILKSVHYRGFDGWVVRSHLILPHG